MICRRDVLAGLSGLIFHSSAWGAPETYLTPEQFGADPTGQQPSSTAFLKMFEAAMQSGATCRPGIADALYRFDRAVSVMTKGRPLRFVGYGRLKTRIFIDGTFKGLSINGTQGQEASVLLQDFSISRTISSTYPGPIGNRPIEIIRSNGVILRGIEEFGSIGYGIFLDRCSNYEISGCIVHDHVSGKVHRSGTDGIHIYRSPGPGKVFNNTVYNVGDDAISFGSYLASEPTTNFTCYSNIVSDTAGSIKVYGNARTFEIYNNTVTRPKTGGVVVWDDRNGLESFVISGGIIRNNTVLGQLGAGICGAISIWSPTGDGTGRQENIAITDNVIDGCNFGITVVSQVASKYVANIKIENNTIRNVKQRGITVDAYGGPISVKGNDVRSTGFEGIYLGKLQPGQSRYGLSLSGNTVRDYALSDRRRYAISFGSAQWIVGNNEIYGAPERWYAPNSFPLEGGNAPRLSK